MSSIVTGVPIHMHKRKDMWLLPFANGRLDLRQLLPSHWPVEARHSKELFRERLPAPNVGFTEKQART